MFIQAGTIGSLFNQDVLGVYLGRKPEAGTSRVLFPYKILEGGMLTKANAKSQMK